MRQPPRARVHAILPDEASIICRIFEPSGGRRMAKLDRDDLGVYEAEQPRKGDVCVIHVKEGCPILVGISEAEKECLHYDMGGIRRGI